MRVGVGVHEKKAVLFCKMVGIQICCPDCSCNNQPCTIFVREKGNEGLIFLASRTLSSQLPLFCNCISRLPTPTLRPVSSFHHTFPRAKREGLGSEKETFGWSQLQSLGPEQRDARPPRVRTARFPPPARWRRPCPEWAECGCRKPGCRLGGASGEGPGAADRGWRDAVPGKRGRLPLRKLERGVAFPASPMYASSRSGPVAALPASVPPVTLGARSSGGGRDRVPREGRRPGGARACGRGASVWQVSAAAHAGDSHPGDGAGAGRPGATALLHVPGLPFSGLLLAAGSRAPRLPFPHRGRGSPWVGG
ncbi:hypothetical protein LEMLEM_LOCUS7349 [Lemmus lemmus]